jgi:CMP-N-acetylneuraminic acid synthetase
LIERHNRLGVNPLMFEMDADQAWDIDEELDFEITEFLMNHKTKAAW